MFRYEGCSIARISTIDAEKNHALFFRRRQTPIFEVVSVYIERIVHYRNNSDMQAELVEMGAQLRRLREERHLSQREVENATSIRAHYIECIEQGHLGKLISPVYAQGFIKKYAAFLELDPDAFLRQYPQVIRALSERAPEQLSLLSSVEVRGSPGGEVKWLPNFLWVAATVAIILLGWFVAHNIFGLF